jgi:Neprosin
MAGPKGFPSLKEFVDSVRSQKHSSFLARNLPGSKVANENAFADMQAHILSLYDNTEAVHSFTDETGAVYDCIPAEQQTSLRGSRGGIPSAPDAPKHEAARGPNDERQDSLIDSPLGLDKKDRFGNVMHCPEGTIPMRRVTMEQLTRFETLRDFFRKGPRGAGRPPRMIEPPTVPATHRWAHAYQNVSNGGGHSYLNLWDPSIDTGNDQIFSLSQHWYVGGSGGNLQTIECGWQVYPQFYGDNSAHLFTYWTADDYNTTGCYNLTCGAFVQLPGAPIAPGMALGSVSVIGGPQYSMELTYWHTGGRWWLYYNGTSGSNAIGYYPDTLYSGGALAGNATEIDYGGETVGTTSFPPMGSGYFANEGWQRAAYQRTIGYYPPLGGAMVDANLTPSQAWPSCYTAQVNMYASPWFETLWFGGAGGSPC